MNHDRSATAAEDGAMPSPNRCLKTEVAAHKVRGVAPSGVAYGVRGRQSLAVGEGTLEKVVLTTRMAVVGGYGRMICLAVLYTALVVMT